MEQVIDLRNILPKKEEKYFQVSIPFRDLKTQINGNLKHSTKGINVNEDNLNKLYQYFRKRYSRKQTLTILSSIIAESGTDPLKTEVILQNNKLVPKGPGFGLLQYTNESRKNKMLEYKSNDFPDSELMRQAEFIHGEIQGSKKFLSPKDRTQWLKKNGAYRNQFFNPDSSLKDLNEAFVRSFVRPANEDRSVQKRIEISEYLDSILPSEYKIGGRFTPRKSKIVKDSEILNNTKRDMRKKLVSGTSWPSIKKRIIKKHQGGTLDNEFLDYTNVETPEVSLSELTFDTSDFNPYSYISTEPFKDETPDKISEDTSKQEQVKPAAKKEKSVVRTNITSFDFDPKLGLMGEFVKIATEEGIPFRVTSGYRPGASTSNGSPSWHSKGLALDIVPKHGVSWEAFQNHFKNSPRTLKWIRDNKFGILDETTPEMLAKTGGTGAHWHIGKDKIAVNSFSKMFPLDNNENI